LPSIKSGNPLNVLVLVLVLELELGSSFEDENENEDDPQRKPNSSFLSALAG
jgi:hypothetical protein